jgi:hypothetical protein
MALYKLRWRDGCLLFVIRSNALGLLLNYLLQKVKLLLRRGGYSSFEKEEYRFPNDVVAGYVVVRADERGAFTFEHERIV